VVVNAEAGVALRYSPTVRQLPGQALSNSYLVNPMQNSVPTGFRVASGMAFLCLLFGNMAVAAGNSGSQVLARVGGVNIERSEVENLVIGQMRALDQKRYELLESALDRAIGQRLIQMEASARGISEADLIKIEISSKVSTPSDADVDAFYEARKTAIKQPKDKVAGQIRQYLQQQAQQEVTRNYLAGLRGKYKVQSLLEPLRTSIATAGEPTQGGDAAKVTIVEFSDFQCPVCRRMEPVLKKVMKNYGDQIRLVYRQFPLANLHPHAEKAAEASLCAFEQKKFWPMHDTMFSDQSKLAVKDLQRSAAKLGMDAKQFKQCLDDGKYAGRVSRDIAEGQATGLITGTPTLFVNGRYISGAVPYDRLASVIDDELQRRGGETKAAGAR